MSTPSVRLLKALILAMLLGLLVGVARSRAAVILYPDPCPYLEPYSPWWYVLYCDQRDVVTESVAIESLSDEYDVMTVKRRFPDGTVLEVQIIAPKKERR
jgi:hypothetical protein